MKRRLVLGPLGLGGLVVLALACNVTRGTGPMDDRSDPPFPSIPPPGVSGPQPDFGPLRETTTAPPTIAGGTLAVAPDGKTAVASDPDRAQIYVVDLKELTTKTIPVDAGDEPGRVAFDATHAFVAMRSSGDVLGISLTAEKAPTRTRVCASPRGIAFDEKNAVLHVACAEGELVSMSPGGTVTRRIPLERDLRDVVVRKDGQVWVSLFRSAEVLKLDGVGALITRNKIGVRASMAWRMMPPPPAKPGTTTPGGSEDEPVTAGQSASDEPVKTTPGGYGSAGSAGSEGCNQGIVSGRLEMMGKSVLLPQAVLPVDVATNGKEFVTVAAGNGHTKALPQLFIVQKSAFLQIAAPPVATLPNSQGEEPGDPNGKIRAPAEPCGQFVGATVPGQAVAAAFDGQDRLIVQSREPAALYIMTEDRKRVLKTIELSAASREDTGHAIFHSNAGGFVSCASCHGEGGDDGRTWKFVGLGARRTPSLRGTVAHTEPFHWNGDQKDMADLAKHVFVERMSGPKLEAAQTGSLQRFVFAIPAPARPATLSESAARGKDQFSGRGCATCHSGGMLTNNQSVDVGTGGIFQVPSLVGVSSHGPFLHDGCAKTLEGRFTDCGGGAKHGNTADMTEAQRKDLVSYLETL